MSVVDSRRLQPPNATLASRPTALSPRASFWVAAGVVAHTLWTSAAPAMSYRLYAEHWQLSHTVTTGIFAIYPLFVVAVLIVFGDLSDYIGRRTTMLFGLTASLLGVLLFAIAPSVLWLFVGRALMGIGVGLSVGPSTAAMVEFGTDAQVKRAASVTAIAQAFGFAAALLVGGALTQYAPWPMHLSFWVLLVLLGGLFVAVWLLPRQVRAPAAGTWRPRTPSVPSVLRPPFAIAALAVTTAYTHGVLVLSLGGQVAHDLVGSPNAFLNGAVLALFAIASALAGAMTRRLSPSLSMILGAVASAVGMTLLALSIAWHGVWLFLAANVMTGIGYGLLFLGGLALLNAVIPAQHRGGVLSTLYLFAYLALGVVALGLGVVATHTDLGLAVDLGAGIVALLSLAVIVILVVRRKGSFLSDTAFL